MRYQVPQFIEVEDKIFGPLTFRQFIYLLGSGGFAFIMFRLLPFFLAFILSAPVVALGLALAFYKINNKPFISILEAAFKYVIGGKLYVWKKEQSKKEAVGKRRESVQRQMQVPKLSSSRLEDLAWGLDINDKLGEQ